MSELRCMVVTPERTELDVQTTGVTVPMFDGEMGILPGHSPLVGRLGYGILRISEGSGTKEYFVEGGFVQVSGGIVSVLTDRVTARSEISGTVASEAMSAAEQMPSTEPEQQAARDKALVRARALTRAAS